MNSPTTLLAKSFRHIKIVALLAFSPLCLIAKDVDKYAPQEVVKKATPDKLPESDLPQPLDDDAVLIPEMKGLLIVGSSRRTQKIIVKKVHGVVIEDLYLPGNSEELINRLTPLIIGKPLTKNLLSKIKREIVLYYRGHHRPLVMVLVPEQDVTDGVLQLTVMEGKVGEVIVKGQRYFSEHDIRKALHLKKGDIIDTDRLLTDVAWLNQNPFRQTNIVFKAGEKNGTTDVELITKDRLPYRFYAGGDNTGNPLTGQTRLFAGVNWGNVLNIGHLLSFQWTTSIDAHKFRAYTGSYTVFLPWRHTLNVFGGYSQVNPEFTGFRSEGWSAQASSRYIIPLGTRYGSFQQDLQFGYDFKQTNNNLQFADNRAEAIETKAVQLSQFVAEYHFSYMPPRHILNFEFDLYFSPAQKWFEHQTPKSYNRLQPGATPIYAYTTVDLSEEYTFSRHGWRLFFEARGQLSNKILLPSEQFGLGGYETVRGYIERIVNYDNAVCLNFELRTPSVQPSRLFTKKRFNDAFYGLVFADYGYGRPHKHEKPVNHLLDPPGKTLVGVGPGLRYSISPYMTARIDLGFPLITVENNGRKPRIHFGVLLSY